MDTSYAAWRPGYGTPDCEGAAGTAMAGMLRMMSPLMASFALLYGGFREFIMLLPNFIVNEFCIQSMRTMDTG